MRVRLLGENLIAFRTTSGQVGLLGDNCPHRGASLFFGRNEEEGLRCVYHGWKFDVAGNCTDMPNEPAESNFKHKIHHTAYPCRELNGIVWTYMGDGPAPGLPGIEWAGLPEAQRYVSKRVQECNWVQGFEGGIDSSHSAFLHSRLDGPGGPGQNPGNQGVNIRAIDKHPRFETVETPFGVLIAARRNAGEDRYYWRVTPFVMPFYNIIPPYGPSPTIGGLAWVPMDDTTTMVWSITWHPTRALTDDEIGKLRSYPGGGIHIGPEGLLPPTSAPGGAWRTVANQRNDFLLDRELERTKLFIGIANLSLQDQAVQESMGAIFDRTREHLGSSDTGIIAVRRRLMAAARALQQDGTTPPGVDPETARVRSASYLLPRGVSWLEAGREHFVLRPGEDYVAV